MTDQEKEEPIVVDRGILSTVKTEVGRMDPRVTVVTSIYYEALDAEPTGLSMSCMRTVLPNDPEEEVWSRTFRLKEATDLFEKCWIDNPSFVCIEVLEGPSVELLQDGTYQGIYIPSGTHLPLWCNGVSAKALRSVEPDSEVHPKIKVTVYPG